MWRVGHLWLQYWISTCHIDNVLLNFPEGNAESGNGSFNSCKAKNLDPFLGSSGGYAFTLWLTKQLFSEY